MKPNTVELLAQLQQATEGLFYDSENDFPFKTFAIEVNPNTDKNEEFQLEVFLEFVEVLQPASFIELLEYVSEKNNYVAYKNNSIISLEKYTHFEDATDIARKMGQDYQILISLLQFKLLNIKVFSVGRAPIADEDWLEEEDTEIFYMIVGETIDGNWLGLVPNIETQFSSNNSNIKPSQNSLAVSKATLELKSQFKSATVGLVFPYETFSGSHVEIVDNFLFKTAKSKDALIQKLLTATGFVTVSDFQGFGCEYLDRLLRSHLTNLRKYVVGGYSCFHIYTVGQTQDGEWIGVSTQAVLT